MSNVVTTWGQLANAPWSNRSGHKSVVLSNGDVIMCGGVDNTNSYKNDVWKYSNNTWSLVRASAEWTPRFNHILLKSSDLLGDKLILLGGIGLNQSIGEPEVIYDAWQSLDDGKTWRTFVNIPRTIEEGYIDGVILSDNTIIITTQSQVWTLNIDGTWNQISGQLQQPPWRIRIDYALHVLSDDSLIIAGGIRSGVPLNDIWISRNRGLQWTQLNPRAEWEPRSGHKIVGLSDGTLALLSGTDSFSNTYYGDIWISSNGVNWVKHTSTYIGRELFSVVSISNNILLFGGKSVTLVGGNIITTIYNDVWEYESFSFSFSISSSSFQIGSNKNNKKTKLPDNQLEVNINIPANLASYIASTSTQFQIQLIKDENIIQTINTPSTITFPFNDFDGTNWKVITSIDINGSILQQDISFTFTNFPPLQPIDISYIVSSVSDNSYNYDVIFDYNRSLNNADTNYPLPENAIFDTVEYTLTEVSNTNGLYVYKFTVPNNTTIINASKQLTLKTGTLTNTPVEFDILFKFLKDIINPTYRYRYTTSPVASFVDVSFQYNNEFGINKIEYQLDGYANIIELSDVYDIPNISFSVPNEQYSLSFATTQIQFERFGEKNQIQTISKINVSGMNDFDLQVNSTFDGTNHNVAIQTLNTPEFTNAIYEIIDISRVEVTTNEYTFVFSDPEHFGKPMDISATLYRVNLNVSKTEHTQIAPYIKPTIQFVNFTQSFVDNKIRLELDVANPSTTNLDVSYTLFEDGNKIANDEDTFDTLFSANKFIYEISTDVENRYSLPFSLDIFFIESTVPIDYNRFGIGGEIDTTPLIRPARPTQFTAIERFESPTLYIDASFVASSQFNKVRLIIASDGTNVYNGNPDFTNQGTYYDISVDIDSTYLGRDIDLSLNLIDVNETRMSSDVITTKINAEKIKSPFVNIVDTSYIYLNNTTTFRLELSGEYTTSDILRYYVKKYDVNHDLINVLSETINFTNTLTISLTPETQYESDIYGFFYEVGVSGRSSTLPNEERFFSDITSVVLLPNITPITISSINVVERYINETVFDVSFTIANIPNTDYTYIDVSLLDGTSILYNQRILKNEFVQTGNVIYKQLELAGSEHFGKQLILRYNAKYLNDPYEKIKPINYQINALPELKLVSFDTSMNIKGNTLIFNIASLGQQRQYINGDTLRFELINGTTTIFNETNPFTTSIFYVGTPATSFYGKPLKARCTWIPLYYPERPEWNDSIEYTFNTVDYAIRELTELNGVLEVNENTGRIEYTPILKFDGLPSLTHIDNITSFNYPQQRSGLISNDYQIKYDICANGVLLQSVIQDGSGNLVQDGTQYRGTTFNYDLTNFGKVFTIRAAYSLKNTELSTTNIQTIDSGTRPDAPLSISLTENYSFAPDLSYGFAFNYKPFEFSRSLDFVYLSIYNVTKSNQILNDKISLKDFIQTDNTYTLDFAIQSNPAFYNDILDVSCQVEHFTLISNPRTKRIQNTLEPPYDLNAIAILNIDASPSVAYEISNITFLHDGKGVPPFASVSYELFHLTDNTQITTGTITYNDLVKTGTEVVKYRFPNVIGIDAEEYYLDPLRLTIQLIYENLITDEVSYSGFNFINNPTKPDILGAKYNPSLDHIHITFQHPEDSTWHFSNVVLYVGDNKVYDANYRLKDYDSPFTNKLIDFDINDVITDRIYSLDVSLDDVDVSVRADIQAGNTLVDVCLNVITDLIGTETISLKASDYDSLKDDLVFDIEFQNLGVIDVSLQYHDFRITYDVVPPEEQEFISEYELFSYSSSSDVAPVDTSYSLWKTIEVNDYPEVNEYLDGTQNKLIPDDYYWFKIIGKHGTSLSSTLANSTDISFQAPPVVLELDNATFDFGHDIRKNILDVAVSFTLDVAPVRENMNIILDISGFNNQVRPTEIYDGELIPIEFPVELPTLTPKIYIYNDWKQNIFVSAKYKNVELNTLNYVIETPITLEDISAVTVRNGLYKTTYVVQWKKILLTAQIEIYSYIAENVLLTYEEALAIPFEQYTLFGLVTTFQSSFSFNQPRMRDIPLQTQVIRFRAVYNPESELSDPLVFYQTNCGYPTLITPETNPKKAIVNKPQFTKKELYAKGFRGRLF